MFAVTKRSPHSRSCAASALLTIENDWFQYPCYHRTCDQPGNLVLAMAREILKMNVAALGQMIGFGTPLFVDGSESGDTAVWSDAVGGM